MQALLADIRHIIAQARERVARSVNHERTVTYWHIGRRLVEEEQSGNLRADYGKRLIADLGVTLTKEFGDGFSANNLWRMKDLYLTFPILDALSQELSWTHYRVGPIDLDRRPDGRLGRIRGRLVEHRDRPAADAFQSAQGLLQNARGLHAGVGHNQRPGDAHALAFLLEQLDRAVVELDLRHVIDEGHGGSGTIETDHFTAP